MRLLIAITALFTAIAGAVLARDAGIADACAGLIGSNGAVNLGRTTTLAGYHDGVEHYVTAFQFQGGGGQFGTLIPLPGVPTNVERGGAWTLQRLQLETQRFRALNADAAAGGLPASGATVLQQVRIDALDLTVLKGGGADVAVWTKDHGFSLSPDAPEVLDFYAQRSPIFLAAVFDGEAAAERGQQIGDGTPVHLTIPLDNPWVPLRILGLGKQSQDRIDADVFLLTDSKPALLPAPADDLGNSPLTLGAPSAFALVHSQAASQQLLDDLRGDDGMAWVPQSAWLTKLQINSDVSGLRYDLAADTSGNNSPSLRAAGIGLPLSLPNTGAFAPSDDDGVPSVIWPVAGALVLIAAFVLVRRRASGAGR